MQRRKEKKKRYNANRKKKWYLAKINTSIYVKGLAPELSREELDSYFGKCGVLRVDPKNGVMLYIYILFTYSMGISNSLGCPYMGFWGTLGGLIFQVKQKLKHMPMMMP